MNVMSEYAGMQGPKNEDLQSLIDASPDVICSFDKEGRFLFVSAACESLWGYKPLEMIGTLASKYLLPEDRFLTKERADALIAGANLTNIENRYIRKDGSIVPIIWSARWDSQKQALYCVAKDGTQKKIAERDGKLQERRLYRAYRLAGIAWWELDIASQTYTSSDEIFHMYGLPIPLENKTTVSEFLSHLHPEDVPRLQTDLAQLCEDTYFQYEHRIVKPTGEVIYVLHYSELIRDENGVPVSLHGTTQNITEQKLQEEQERLLQERYRLLFYESPVPKWIYSENTMQILEVNNAACTHYGWSREEFMSMSVLDIRSEAQRAEAVRMHQQNRGKLNLRFHGLTKHKTRLGQIIDVEVTSHAFAVHGDIHIVVVAADVTEKLAAQKKIAQTIIQTQEKERSVIGKELHDNVNQLLTTAKLYFENADYYPEQRTLFMQKGTGIIQRCISEIRGLSKALVTPTINDLSFKDALDELVTYYRELNTFEIELEFSIDDTSLEKELKLTLYRILQELFNNTIKYAKASKVSIYFREGKDYMSMVYVDDGIGFDTGSPRQGVGISNIKSRVTVSKGKVRFHSKEGGGCKVLFVFAKE